VIYGGYPDLKDAARQRFPRGQISLLPTPCEGGIHVRSTNAYISTTMDVFMPLERTESALAERVRYFGKVVLA